MLLLTMLVSELERLTKQDWLSDETENAPECDPFGVPAEVIQSLFNRSLA